MIFTITITEPKGKPIFKDVFTMDSEKELLTAVKFLKSDEKPDNYLPAFHLEVNSLDKVIINVFTTSLFTIQNIKDKIYETLIDKIKTSEPPRMS